MRFNPARRKGLPLFIRVVILYFIRVIPDVFDVSMRAIFFCAR
jgi:hypothetical protein